MRIAIALALTAATLSYAGVGDWTSFTPLNVIRDLEGSRGNLFAATTGGIRKIDAKGAEKVYRNTEGLRDVGISALAAGPDGQMYATSELGYVYRYDSGADNWEILGASYRGAGWRMNKRALMYREGYLVIGSEKGLSFFNVKRKVAEANVSKMGSVNGMSVNSLLFVGDTLFAGTSRGIFRTVLHLEKLLTDPQINIFNPGIWSRVDGTDGVLFFRPESKADDSAALEDSLAEVAEIIANKPVKLDDAGLYSHGFLYYGPAGIASEYEGSSIPEQNTRISAYGNIVMDGRAVVKAERKETIATVGGKWYTGAVYGLSEFFPELGKFQNIENAESVPTVEVTALRANRYGIHALATPFIYKLDGKVWTKIENLVVNSDFNDIKVRGQHAFDVTSPARIFVGSWGAGFHAYVGGKLTTLDALNSCIASADERAANFPVIWSQAAYKDKGIWMSIFFAARKYQLAYYDHSTGKVSCFEPNVKDNEPRNVQVVGDSALVVITERGVEAYGIIDNGGPVSLDPVNLLGGLASAGEASYAGKMDRLGNFWVTTEQSHLLYIPSIEFNAAKKQAFRTLDGFAESGCINIEIDPQGHLWLGCRENGIIEVTPSRDSLAHTYRKYGLNDGLLSESIYHMDVNPETGEVWVATEKGIARLESASRPTLSSLSSLKVYPNPFLAKHAGMVFSNLSSGSEIRVTTQSGSVVFHKSLVPGAGDQIRWDGRNQSGDRVREGVYFYVVKSPRETKNGKIIVAR